MRRSNCKRFQESNGLPMFAKLMAKIDAFFTDSTLDEGPGVAKPDFNTQMAIERTLLAHERTLMAWVRTAASHQLRFYHLQIFPVGGEGARADLTDHRTAHVRLADD